MHPGVDIFRAGDVGVEETGVLLKSVRVKKKKEEEKKEKSLGAQSEQI